METLKNRWGTVKNQPIQVRDAIINECGKSISWFYDALIKPEKLSQAEKAVFEKHIGGQIIWESPVLLPE